MKAGVVVIGGGIVGAACAYYLCRAGLDVHLLERNFPGSGTSRACDGLILLWDKLPGVELELGKASARLWQDLPRALDFDFEYARVGSVMVVESADAWPAASARAEQLGAAGVPVEIVDPQGLRTLEPHLAPDLAGALFFPDDAQVDARRATLSLLRGATREGLKITCGAPVTAIRRDAAGRVAGVTVATGDDIETEAVVCAAGVWSNELAALAGVALPLRPRKGHILVAAGAPGFIRHPLLEGSYAAAVQSTAHDVQVALVAEMTAWGTLLLGSSREFTGFDRSVSLSVMQAIAARAVRFLPGLDTVSIIRSYSGLRPWSPDHLPLIGPVAAVPGLYITAGHEGAGIGLAPITGQMIAAWITGDGLAAAAAEVSPDRFDEERCCAKNEA